jgi:formylglycine-generating enzyme required for sulfatase activity
MPSLSPLTTAYRSVATASFFWVAASGCATVLDIDKDYSLGDPSSTTSAMVSGSSSGPASGGGGAAGGSTGAAGGTGGNPIECPQGMGPPMVDVGGFCIDTREVTNAEYAAWLVTNPDDAPGSRAPPSCTFNTAFWDTTFSPAPPTNEKPVAYVDWCDAYAFCLAAGKRLCGAIGGGPVEATVDWLMPDKSQWMHACSQGGTATYSYGDTYEGSRCNGIDAGVDAMADAASFLDCHGGAPPFEAIFDMSGNAYEWEDSCDGDTGATDSCHRRGGSYNSNDSQLRCTGDDTTNVERSATGSTVGFRCCAP